VSHRYCLQCVGIPHNKAHYFGEKGEIIFHLDFVYHTLWGENLNLKGPGCSTDSNISASHFTYLLGDLGFIYFTMNGFVENWHLNSEGT